MMKEKFPSAAAREVAEALVKVLNDFVEAIIIAGSLRRDKAEVGDIELLYIPAMIQHGFDLSGKPEIDNVTNTILQDLIDKRVIERRRNAKGAETWGEKIKLARHVASGIPVDFFETTHESWFNYLVCRTGSAESNTRIASAAKRKGWKWEPYSPGFLNEYGQLVKAASEREVFELAGLKYLLPHERN